MANERELFPRPDIPSLSAESKGSFARGERQPSANDAGKKGRQKRMAKKRASVRKQASSTPAVCCVVHTAAMLTLLVLFYVMVNLEEEKRSKGE